MSDHCPIFFFFFSEPTYLTPQAALGNAMQERGPLSSSNKRMSAVGNGLSGFRPFKTPYLHFKYGKKTRKKKQIPHIQTQIQSVC